MSILTGYHLRAKQKARANDHALLRKSLALALKALAVFNIHHVFGLTDPAIDRQPDCHGVRRDPKQVPLSRTFGTHKKTIYYS